MVILLGIILLLALSGAYIIYKKAPKGQKEYAGLLLFASFFIAFYIVFLLVLELFYHSNDRHTSSGDSIVRLSSWSRLCGYVLITTLIWLAIRLLKQGTKYITIKILTLFALLLFCLNQQYRTICFATFGNVYDCTVFNSTYYGNNLQSGGHPIFPEKEIKETRKEGEYLLVIYRNGNVSVIPLRAYFIWKLDYT